jgi:hypothetical protein
MDRNSLERHVPEPVAWLRAAVSSIPMVGSALDHLLFDKKNGVRFTSSAKDK